MFYNMRFVRLRARESAKLAINAAHIFWQQARIPIRAEARCVDKLVKMYEKWKQLQKTVAAKRSEAQKKVIEQFIESLDDLFDIASADVLETLLKKFLLTQREKGRPGCMAGVDMVLFGREKRAQERRVKENARKRKQDELEAGTARIIYDFS